MFKNLGEKSKSQGHFIVLGEIVLMFLTILLYFCTSIRTLLYLVKYCSLRAQNKHMRSGLKPLFIHQVIAQKALVLYDIRKVRIEVQEYRSIVRNEGND